MKSFVKFILLLAISIPSFSQKMSMMVDEDLLANSEAQQIKVKGIAAMPKYYFGDYAVTDGKQGWTKSNSSQGFFNPTVTTNTKQKFSFTLQGPTTSAEVNASIREFTQEVNAEFGWLGNFSMMTAGTLTFNALISLNDSSDWELAFVNDLNNGIKAGIKSADEQFEIQAVMVLDNGKRPLGAITPVLGYTIYNQGLALAAIQTGLKNYIWIRTNLPEDMRLKLAASALSLLRFEQAITTMN